MAQQAANALGVAAAALALGIFQTVGGDTELVLRDFQGALFLSAAVVALAILWSLRLPADAGAELSRRC